jgi:hypothetical protein
MDVDDTPSAAEPNPAAGTQTEGSPAAHPRVASATEELDSLDGRPLDEHPDAYEQVHAHLSEALASVDDA